MIRSRAALASLAAAFGAVAFFVLRQPGIETVALQGYDDVYQLALGQKAASGAWPASDFFTNYGPGVAVVSALSWAFLNPILAEVCSGLLLLSLGQWLFWRAGRSPGRPASNGALWLALLCAAPVAAKYAYSLGPALFLVLLGDPGEAKRGRARWLAIGASIGLASWFRLELGLACGAALAGALALRARTKGLREAAGATGLAALGAAAPWAAYFGAASIAHGAWRGPWPMVDFYIASTFAKTADFAGEPPALSSFFSSHPDMLALQLAAYLAAVALVVAASGAARGPAAAHLSPARRRAWAAAALALCLSPQAMHRPDHVHLTHVLAPALVALHLACAGWAGQAAGWRRVSVAAALAGALVMSLRVHHPASPPWNGAAARWRGLTAGLDGLDPATPSLRLASAIRAAAGEQPDATLVVPSIDTRLHVLSGIPFAGALPHWSYRLPERWQQRHLEALRRDRPTVAVDALYFRASPSAGMRALDRLGRNPALDDYLAARFTRVAYADADWRVLTVPPDENP